MSWPPVSLGRAEMVPPALCASRRRVRVRAPTSRFCRLLIRRVRRVRSCSARAIPGPAEVDRRECWTLGGRPDSQVSSRSQREGGGASRIRTREPRHVLHTGVDHQRGHLPRSCCDLRGRRHPAIPPRPVSAGRRGCGRPGQRHGRRPAPGSRLGRRAVFVVRNRQLPRSVCSPLPSSPPPGLLPRLVLARSLVAGPSPLAPPLYTPPSRGAFPTRWRRGSRPPPRCTRRWRRCWARAGCVPAGGGSGGPRAP